MSQPTKTVITQEVADTMTAAYKVLHHAVLNHLVSNKLPTDDIPADFTKCTFETYKKVTLLSRGMLVDKSEADIKARLLPYTAAIAKATETYMLQAVADWAIMSALPQEVRERMGVKPPTTVKVPVSSFATAWKTPTDMARDLVEMKVKVIKGTKGDYIEVGFAPATTTTATVAKAA